jgi:hypothetical protein
MPTTQTNGDAALAAFLLAHLGHVEDNDVGPWIGQAAWYGERGERLAVSEDVQRVLNVALAGDAARGAS